MSPPRTTFNGGIFGTIPPELRRMIYSLCFQESNQQAWRRYHPLLARVRPEIVMSGMATVLAPLQVSTQMRIEALEFLLGGKTVVIDYHNADDTVDPPLVFLGSQSIAEWTRITNNIPPPSGPLG